MINRPKSDEFPTPIRAGRASYKVLVAMALLSTSFPASSQIPKGTIIFDKGTSGTGCMLNGKSYGKGETVKVEVDNKNGTKSTVSVACTADGWKKV